MSSGDHSEYLAMLGRMIRAAGRRVADSDPADLAELLAALDDLDYVIAHAVAAQRAAGFTWTEIGTALGVSRQSAHKRWAARCATFGPHDTEGRETSQ